MTKMNQKASQDSRIGSFRSWVSQEKRGKLLVRRILGENIQTSHQQTRQIRFEPLERRELMANDFYEAASLQSQSLLTQFYGASADVVSKPTIASTRSGLVAEGEATAAVDLVAFAKALTAAGAKFYGADWCTICTDQKKLFQEGKNYLPFVEVTNPDRTINATGTAENITTFPTWKFANGQIAPGLQTIEQLSTISGVAIPTGTQPTFVEVPNQTVRFRSPVHVPIDTYDPNGGPLTVTVTSSNPNVITAEMVNNPKSVRMVVNGYGEMVFRLFPDEASRPVNQFEQLVNSGFYNQTANSDIIFHRVVDGFMIQAGDPTGTGSGGSTLSDFDDQFNLNLQHNRSGVLSYAKAGPDTNDSQFFITEVATRHLDFKHSIFGQLIEGEAVREGISRTKVTSQSSGEVSRPVNEVVIKSMEIFNDTKNGLVRLKSLATSGTSNITVTVTNSTGQSFSRTFTATAAADTSNGAPFLNDINVPPIAAGQTVTVQLGSQDKEGDAVAYDATRQGSVPYQFNMNSQTGLLSVTAPTNFTGQFQVRVSVRPASTSSASSSDDAQVLTFNVPATVAAPTSVDLVAASDTGSSDTDNVTSAGNLQFLISGTTSGANVQLRIGNQVIGSAVASGDTTTITTNQIAPLGSGTYSIVAVQTVSGTTSAASPALSIVYDNVAPSAIANNALPTRANVGTPLNFDLNHPEEGQGLRYVLDNAPAGMSIDQLTGLISWTPTSNQLGPQTAILKLQDKAGNISSQTLAISVADTAKIAVDMFLQTTSGQPLTTIAAGQEFLVKLVVQDLRTGGSGTGEGVFTAYVDLNYDSSKVEPVATNPITYDQLFQNGKSGDLSVPGLINELGAFSSLTAGPGRDPQNFVTVRMRAKAGGTAKFTMDEADEGNKAFGLFLDSVNSGVPANRVLFDSKSLNVTSSFTAVDDSFSVNEDTTNNSIDVLANDTLSSGSNSVLSLVSVSTPDKGGTVSIASGEKTLVYTPAPNFNGVEKFTYVVRDQSGVTGTATVTMNVQSVNDNPVAVNDVFDTVKSNQTDVFLNVLGNDTSGPDTSETLTVTSVGTPSQGGTVKIATGGNGVLFTPKANFVGADTFTYTISDGKGGSATGNVTVNVQVAVPTPIVTGESFTVVEDSAETEFDVLANDLPAVTGDTLSIASAQATNGTVNTNAAKTRLLYKPNANFVGTDRVVYTVRSSNGGTAQATATITVTSVNDAPNAVADQLTVTASANQSLNVLANDTNVDANETLTISAVTQPEAGKGTVSIATDMKSLLYSAPSASFTGEVNFTYTISDGNGLSSTANVKLNVVNFTPRAVGVTTNTSVQGVRIDAQQIEGAGVNGTPIDLTPQQSGSLVKVPDVGPGTYKFSVPALPFFTPAQTAANVVSAPSDGDSLSTPLNVGSRDPKFMDVRDFTSKALRKGITLAVQPNQQALWHDGVKDWRSYSNIQVTLNQAATQLTINAIDPTNKAVTTTLATSDPRVRLRAKEGANHLFRIQAAPSELNFTPVPPPSSSTATSGGEGEGGSTSRMAAPPVVIDKALGQLSREF
ncbi:MAG: tandem-95 repeat protein [Planctomycetaceae bacterium]|jgi:cyclophilin family peptidyl-prolyl cis-trans isomerase|nr:tandem-95 repeat protein [Planctomycetaceae bacterium]